MSIDLRLCHSQSYRWLMIVSSFRTADGRWLVHVHHDQRAELWEKPPGQRWPRCVLRDVPLYRVTDRLVAEGIDFDDLIRD